MSRPIVLGNGELLVGLDARGLVRDFYYPYAGHSNHVSGASGSYVHRIGVWIDGRLTWLHDGEWNVHILSSPNPELDTHIVEAVHGELGLTLTLESVVHNEQNVFIRSATIHNQRDTERHVRIFFGQEFRISESQRGDTAFYDPRVHGIIHYKGHNAFLVYATHDGRGFDDYSVGLFGIEGKLGTFADAEDGVLSKNAVEHGSVDSVVSVHIDVKGNDTACVHYWVIAAKSIQEAHTLQGLVLTETPERLMASTERYWSAWSNEGIEKLDLVSAHERELCRRSLITMKVHADTRGGIIASSDTDILNQGRDSYSYVWPRDSALTVTAFCEAGYFDVAERYFMFMAERLEPPGYLMHKYRVDGVLGSSWHPWVRNGKMELPIQEDETAIVLFALGQYHARARNIEFIESLYNSFIEPAADFLAGYIEPNTGLPLGSYDLWEEKYGMSTYTASAVYGGLQAAAEFSALLGKRSNALKYRARAEKLAHAITDHLYDQHTGTFIKLIRVEGDGTQSYDRTIDMSSIHGVTQFGVLPAHDARVTRAFNATIAALSVPGNVGGYMRYEGDNYYREGPDHSPNPWCITTLWVAQHYIQVAKTQKELRAAHELLEWVRIHASESGILPEQFHPETGAHLSTSPLVWSHAEYVLTLFAYERKVRALKTKRS